MAREMAFLQLMIRFAGYKMWSCFQ